MGGAYAGGGASMYPASPHYGATIGAGRPGATQAAGNKPAGSIGDAYEPTKPIAGGDAAKNSEDSDSDK